MKRLIFFVLILLMLPMVAQAFEALSSGGVGWIQQQGQKSELGYFVGFAAPIVTKDSAGYQLVNETSYLYSGYSDNVKALRTYAINRKALFTGQDWRFYLGLGAGIWQFLSSSDTGEGEALGAIIVRIGGSWKCVDLGLSGEIIQREGADFFFPSMRVAIGF